MLLKIARACGTEPWLERRIAVAALKLREAAMKCLRNSGARHFAHGCDIMSGN